MTTFAQDTFTDTNGVLIQDHTPEVGAGWTRHGSYTTKDIDIQSNAIKQVAGTAGVSVSYIDDDPAGADYYAQIVLTAPSAAPLSGTFVGVLVRVATAADTFYIFGHLGVATGWQTYRRVAGTFTQLGTTTAATISVGTPYTVRLDVATSGANAILSPTVDSVAKCGGPITDTSAITAAGKAGVRFADSATPRWSGDDFLAADTSGGAAGNPWYYYRQAA